MIVPVLFTACVLLLLFGMYILLELKRIANAQNFLPKRVLFALWVLDLLHFLLVLLPSLYRVWFLPVNEIASALAGTVLLGSGVLFMLAGMIEFRSLNRILGLEFSKLVTTGVYCWNRNPQYLGWFLILFGISLVGRSGFAFLFTILGIILFHFYIIRFEEPHLERIFGEEYRLYKFKVPRYVG